MAGRCHATGVDRKHQPSSPAIRRSPRPEEQVMSATKIVVSYDGTNNEDDALALGRLLSQAGAEVALAYVRHTQEAEPDREVLAQHEAEALLERGANLLGTPDAERYV